MPCERVFLSSTETDTKKHNWIGPTLMEALQMLKYHLKKTQLDFCANWSTTHENLVEDEPECKCGRWLALVLMFTPSEHDLCVIESL